jgi:hypothetical protein
LDFAVFLGSVAMSVVGWYTAQIHIVEACGLAGVEGAAFLAALFGAIIGGVLAVIVFFATPSNKSVLLAILIGASCGGIGGMVLGALAGLFHTPAMGAGVGLFLGGLFSGIEKSVIALAGCLYGDREIVQP